jgi:hypothetical protein
VAVGENPRSKQLTLATLKGRFAPNTPVSKTNLSPFGIVLTDGSGAGKGGLTTRRVARAYFVATASS